VMMVHMQPAKLPAMSNPQVRSLAQVGEPASAADEIVARLTRDCPTGALAFAIAMHERACRAGDDYGMALWQAVVTLLSQGCD